MKINTRVVRMLGWGLIALSASAAPKLRVEPEELDFGAVKTGKPATGEIVLFNEGDAALQVFKVQASCGCSKVELPDGEQPTIAPGEKLVLPVHFDPGNRVGPQQSIIAITTSDPERPAVAVEVRANIEALAVVRPVNGLVWQQQPRGAEVRRTVVIAPGDPSDDIDIVQVNSDRNELTLTANKVTRNGQQMIDLKFSLGETAPLGDFSASVTAKVRVAGEETVVTIPVRGTVVGDVVVSPLEINATSGGIARGERIGALIVRGTKGEEKPLIRGVMVDGPMRAEIKLDRPNENPRVIVHVADDAGAGPQSGTVYVATSSVDQPVIAVPVYFLVKEKINAMPGAVLLDKMRDTARIEFVSDSDEAFTITNVRSDSDRVAVKILEDAAPPAIEVQRVGEQEGDVDARVTVESSLGSTSVLVGVRK